MAWLFLALAIATEIAGTVALRFADGFSRLVPSIVVVVGYSLSFFFLSLTLRQLSLGITYAVWAGIGTAAIAAIGMIALGETVNAVKLGSIVLIIAGVIGLNAAGGH
jgi:small multidrug resistance pump